MVHVMMRINEQLEGFIASFFQFSDKVLGLFRKFCVYDYDSLFRQQEGNSASFFRKNANVVTEHFNFPGIVKYAAKDLLLSNGECTQSERGGVNKISPVHKESLKKVPNYFSSSEVDFKPSKL